MISTAASSVEPLAGFWEATGPSHCSQSRPILPSPEGKTVRAEDPLVNNQRSLGGIQQLQVCASDRAAGGAMMRSSVTAKALTIPAVPASDLTMPPRSAGWTQASCMQWCRKWSKMLGMMGSGSEMARSRRGRRDSWWPQAVPCKILHNAHCSSCFLPMSKTTTAILRLRGTYFETKYRWQRAGRVRRPGRTVERRPRAGMPVRRVPVSRQWQPNAPFPPL